MHLAGLFIYPVKGCRELSLVSAHVDALGLVGDRRFLIVDPSGKYLTQRSHPGMALIVTALDETRLTLSHPRLAPLDISRAPDPAAPLRTVQVWRNEGLLAEACGPAADAWVSAALGTPAHLVRIGEQFHRPVKPGKSQPGDIVSFADAYPFLLIGEASLSNLNDHLAENDSESLPMDRFRPNLVIAGTPAFAEDTWPRLRIGGVIFRSAGPCARCMVTTTDQTTGERLGPEPLRTLARYRRNPTDPNEVLFGQNLIHETKTGFLRISDTVQPL